VIGAGLSVTRFLRFPLVTLLSNKVETLSPSDFWARATVIGAGLKTSSLTNQHQSQWLLPKNLMATMFQLYLIPMLQEEI
jgi:hypothetical protein